MPAINPASFFRINSSTPVTLQIVPDRSVKNWHTNDLARALHELYRDPFACLGIDGRKLEIRPIEHFAFDITMTPETIKFFLTVPSIWTEFVRTKIISLWPRATVISGIVPDISTDKIAGARLTLKNHDFYSLHVARNDNRPLPAVLETSKDLHTSEYIRVQVIARPGDRQQWEHEAEQAYVQHRKGNPLPRCEWSVGAATQKLAKMADSVCQEVYNFATELLCMEIQKKDEKNFAITNDFAKIALRNQQGLTEATVHKIREPVFHTEVRIIVATNSTERSRLLAKGVGGAFNELASTDNEFVIKPVPERLTAAFVREITACKLPIYSMHCSMLSASELGKLMQLPGAELQQDYPSVDQVNSRETDVPAKIIDSTGLWLGTIRHNGTDLEVFMPTSIVDELCLPRVVIGGMGSGKTKGYGGRIIVEAVKKGFTAIGIDPEKGELYNEAISGLNPEQVIRIKFDGQRLIGLDWCEVRHSPNARSRLASNILSFVETTSDETGVQTARFLRSAAKAVSNGKLNEIVKLFTSPHYRKKTIKEMPESEVNTWLSFDQDMTEARRLQIAMPVLNRLDPLTGDDYLNECIEHGESIDFVDMIDNGAGKAIIIDIPRLELSSEAVDVLAALMASKLDIAMVCRKTEHPVFVIQDEPAQYMKSAKTWKDIAVRSRKFRFAYVWMFHAWEQIPRELAAIIKAAGPHYHIYTSSKDTFNSLKEELRPFTIEEFLDVPRHYALNSIWCDGRKAPAFLAKMAPPPSILNKART